MEVLISAAVLMLVVLGTLAAIDTTTRTAGANQARTVAATLAEKDQERLRTLRTTDLDQLDVLELPTRNVTVGKVPYTIASKAEWVNDTTGTEISCSLPSDKGSYLRITSTVTSPITGKAVKPVVLTSIVAPQPGKGTLTASVTGAAGGPVASLPVAETLVGGPTTSVTTNALGCAVFEEADAGSHTVQLNAAGWVDTAGNQASSKSANVSAGNLTTLGFVYDRASSFDVKVVTKRPGAPLKEDDESSGAFAAHTGLPTGYKYIPSASPATTFSFTSMFPFTTAYQVYSGTCTGADPSKFIPSYFAGHPESVVQLTPGGASAVYEAFEPAMDVTAKYSSVLVANARVYAYPKTTGCTSPARISLGSTTILGKLVHPGLPFGTYDICADYTNPGNGKTYEISWAGQANTSVAGTALAANFTSSSTQSSCGASAP